MKNLLEIHGVLHKIKCKLYPNYLPKGGPYLARTDNEASLSIEQVVDRMIDRGYVGNRGDLINYIKLYEDATAYELCDGFAVNTGYFTVYPKVGGTFESVKEPHNPEKNPLSFRFRPSARLHSLSTHIDIEITGVADCPSYIDTYKAQEANLVNSVLIPGHVFSVSGAKIKIAGDDSETGVYFVPVDDPAGAVKVTRIVANTATQVMGVVPELTSKQNRIEIRTYYSGSSKTMLKEPRVITGNFTLELA